MPPNHALIRDMANHLLTISGNDEKIGKHWITRLLERHPSMSTGRSRPSELSRLTSLTFKMVDEIFEAFQAISRLARHGDKKLGTPRSIQLSTLYFIPTLITSI